MSNDWTEAIPFGFDPSDPPGIGRTHFETDEAFDAVSEKALEKTHGGDWCEWDEDVGDFQVSAWKFECGHQYWVVRTRWRPARRAVCWKIFDNAKDARAQYDALVKRASVFVKEIEDGNAGIQ
jgi:hypothetical protein